MTFPVWLEYTIYTYMAIRVYKWLANAHKIPTKPNTLIADLVEVDAFVWLR